MWRVVFAWVFMGAAAAADPFEDALEAWMQGPSVAVLEPFAALAAAGDLRAQVWLGRVAQQPHLWGGAVSVLPRRDRLALLRAPGGLSGKSWLDVAAETDGLAASLVGKDRLADRPAAILDLLDRGEAAIAVEPFLRLLDLGDYASARAAAWHTNALPYMGGFALWLDVAAQEGLNTAVGSARLPITWLRHGPRDVLDDPAKLDEIAADLATRNDLDGVVRLCAPCPAAGRCVAAIAAGVPDFLPSRMASPLRSVVSEAEYAASPRYLGDVAQVVANLISAPAFLHRLDACAHDQVAAYLGR